MNKFWALAFALILLPSMAVAATREEIRKQVEYSLLVKGEIETNIEGRVSLVDVDRPEKFPAGLVDYVKQHVSEWKFEPVLVDGKPARARSSMSLLVVAKKLENGDISIGIRNAGFGRHESKAGESLSVQTMKPPVYPQAMQANGVSGTVYLLLKVGRDGRVEKVAVEKVNLRALDKEKAMESSRAALSNAALKAAREWTFVVPTKGELADDQSWSGWVPVDFEMVNTGIRKSGYREWEIYVPGPRQSIPWLMEIQPGFSPDALADGGIYMADKNNGPKLLTPLDGT